MAYQKDYLRKVGCEGFQLIEECYGRAGGSARRHPPLPLEEPPHEGYRGRNFMYSPAPQARTVFQEPVGSSTAYVAHHGQYQVPAGKQSYQSQPPIPASKEVVYNSKGTTVRRDSYHVPHISRPIEPSVNGSNGSVAWHVYKVTQVPEPNVITSDQAVKNYGGIVSKQYYW